MTAIAVQLFSSFEKLHFLLQFHSLSMYVYHALCVIFTNLVSFLRDNTLRGPEGTSGVRKNFKKC